VAAKTTIPQKKERCSGVKRTGVEGSGVRPGIRD
jgi:hypothetical protein